MSLKSNNIQFVGNIDADTLNGLHASEFATINDIEELRSEVNSGTNSGTNTDNIREIVSIVLEEFSGDEVRY